MPTKLKELKCKPRFIDPAPNRCIPRKLLNKFYYDPKCSENMHGTTLLLTDEKYYKCRWYDSKTNKPINTPPDKSFYNPNSFMTENLHHQLGERKKTYIWKPTKNIKKVKFSKTQKNKKTKKTKKQKRNKR